VASNHFEILEGKVGRLVSLVDRLRDENETLRQGLEAPVGKRRRVQKKLQPALESGDALGAELRNLSEKYEALKLGGSEDRLNKKSIISEAAPLERADDLQVVRKKIGEIIVKIEKLEKIMFQS